MNTNSNSNIENKLILKAELESLGFNEEHINISISFNSDQETAVECIVRMLEDEIYYKEMIELHKKSKLNTINSDKSIDEKKIDMGLFYKNQYKMTIVVRKDLNMSVGKIASQVAHAVLEAYKKAVKMDGENYIEGWENSGCAKIVLQVESLKEIKNLVNLCTKNGVNHAVIADAGRTEVEPGTITVIAIGPAPIKEMDEITGKLELLK